MTHFLFTVSTALLCSHAIAASSYLGIAQGTPLGGFSQHGTLHGGFVPGGLYGNSASLVNHGLPLGHLPGPIYRNRGYLDYAYGTGSHFGYPYGKASFLKYLNGNRLGLANPYGVLPNFRAGGVSEAEIKDRRALDQRAHLVLQMAQISSPTIKTWIPFELEFVVYIPVLLLAWVASLPLFFLILPALL
ncbi:uncharacterized protein LOC125046793 [Penaeus chinensis]|uniref:uncharacterized protein LOC125046793 n=1 Tax=Penaeus chinensis TaxID=139456 RepID=UPI001FB6B743|nr:uncharacterized protein LOC125046793 [Penaeus chinensis]